MTATRRIWARIVVALPLVCMASFLVIAVQPTEPALTPDGAQMRFFVPAIAMMLTVYVFSVMVPFAPDVLTLGSTAKRTQTTTGIGESERRWISDRLQRELDSGAYRDPDLTLTRLAKRIGVHPYRLSMVINQVFGKNFSQLIHDHRLEFLLDRANSGELERYSILRPVFEAGFSSNSTFHRVFSERFKTSPRDYLQKPVEPRSRTV